MTEELSNLIDQYVNGDINRSQLMNGLSDKEISLVEDQLQLIADLGVVSELDEVRTQIKNIATQEKPSGQVVRFPNIYKFTSIAAAILVMVLAYFNFKNDTHPLLEEYANIKEGLPSLMGASDNYQFDDAMTYFKQGEYKVALEKFSNITMEDSGIGQDTLRYFIGLSQFHLKDYNKAISELTSIEGSSAYKSKSLWYVLMSYVALDDIEKVDDQIIRILSVTDHPYIDRAKSFQSSWQEYKKLRSE